MPNIGPLELAVVVIIAIVILGPKKLPEVGRSVGRGIREFKGTISGDDSQPREGEASSKSSAARSDATVLRGEVVHDPKG